MNRHISWAEKLENTVKVFTNTIKTEIDMHVSLLRYNVSLPDNIVSEIKLRNRSASKAVHEDNKYVMYNNCLSN